MASINDLPVEILLRIFHFYLESENQYRLLSIVSKVCTLWETVCQNSSLWIKFDGSVKYKTMKKMCEAGCLDKTKELIISPIEYFSNKDAKELFGRLHNLEVLNLSQIEYFSSKNVIGTLTRCKLKLKEIQIGCKKREYYSTIRYREFETFFTSKGVYLTAIKLSDHMVSNLSKILKCLSDNCPNLEHLRVTNNVLTSGTFPTRNFQLKCPKLKFLHLDHNTHFSSGQLSVGFPNLEVFIYNEMSLTTNIDDGDIKHVLSNSSNLKFLSLPNCCLSAEVLCSLPANSVEYLFLPKSYVLNSSNLPDIFKKWCHSLKQVDISYSNNKLVNDAVLTFTTLPTESTIEFLDLRYTPVTCDTVMKILEKCKHLENLRLDHCRNLDRRFKKNYAGKVELRTLLAKFKTFYSVDEEMSEQGRL